MSKPDSHTMTDPKLFDLVACLWLVKNGVPYDVAFSMDDDERTAHVIVFGQLRTRNSS